LVFFLVIVSLDIAVTYVKKKYDMRIRQWLQQISGLEKVTLFFITSVATIVVLQFAVESYNKRFPYIIDDCQCYSILTTYQNCYLTVESEISNDEITIFRGNVRLFPISDSALEAKQFAIKNIR